MCEYDRQSTESVTSRTTQGQEQRRIRMSTDKRKLGWRQVDNSPGIYVLARSRARTEHIDWMAEPWNTGAIEAMGPSHSVEEEDQETKMDSNGIRSPGAKSKE